MKKSTRLLITFIMVEALLFAIGAWLILSLNNGTLQAANDPKETAQAVLTILGGAMGVFAALVGMTVYSMRRKGL